MKNITDDKQFFKISIVVGLVLILLGFLVNLIMSMYSKGDFNFIGAWVAGLGVLIVVLVSFYAVLKIVTKIILASTKKK